MSVVTGHDFITALVEGDQVTATLYATKPLSQYVKKGTTGVSPDWTTAANQPVIYVITRSQNTGLRKGIQPTSEEWFYNGQKLTFDSSGKCTAPSYVAGKFKSTTYNDGDGNVPALQITGNLASLTNTDNDVITFKGSTEIGGIARPLEPSITIRIEETVGDPHDGYIDATDAGVIDDNTSSITLTAFLTKGGNIVTSGVTYKWSKAIVGGWQQLTAVSGSPDKLKLMASDIDSEAIIRCEFLISSVVVFSTTRPVYDETDPLVLALNPSQSPQLKTGESVTYRPSVHRRSNGQKESTYTKFSFTAFAKDNTAITIPSSQVTTSSCTIKETDVNGIGKGGINLYISTAS